MALSPGQTLSFYEILGPIGAGAMGEVWRARDTRLDREVAIKVLPEHFAEDEERLLRFEREAKSLASLNHPNVAQIYGVDQVEDMCFFALELVDGEGLDERLRRGPLPIAEAVDVCAQIADGLDAAHEAGVIHRDLKPANVRIASDGRVKVLDFGLAKPSRSESSSESSTDSVLTTEAGRLLGTPAYMAPEQARGKSIDRRVDLWALGCLLYECLTGLRPFEGETLSDVLASVLEKEPDLERLPERTPANVRRVLVRCLRKDPRTRLRDAGDARLELEAGDDREDPGPIPAARSGLRAPVAFVAGLAVALAAAAVFYTPPVLEDDARSVRFSLNAMGATMDAFQGVALSPGGERLVFRAREDDGAERLHVRALDSYDVESLEGTDFGWLPFFAPDGDRVGFYSLGELKAVTLSSGLVRTVARLSGGFSGGAWLSDDTIVYTSTSNRKAFRIAADGGSPTEIPLDLLPEYDIVTSPAPIPIEDSFLLAVRRGSSQFRRRPLHAVRRRHNACGERVLSDLVGQRARGLSAGDGRPADGVALRSRSEELVRGALPRARRNHLARELSGAHVRGLERRERSCTSPGGCSRPREP